MIYEFLEAAETRSRLPPQVVTDLLTYFIPDIHWAECILLLLHVLWCQRQTKAILSNPHAQKASMLLLLLLLSRSALH